MNVRWVGQRLLWGSVGAATLIFAPVGVAQWKVAEIGDVQDAGGVIGTHLSRGGVATVAVATGDSVSGRSVRRVVLARAVRPDGLPSGFAAAANRDRYALGSPADNEVIAVVFHDRSLFTPPDGGTITAIGIEGGDGGRPGRLWASTRRSGAWSAKLVLDQPGVVGPTTFPGATVGHNANGDIAVGWIAGDEVHATRLAGRVWSDRVVGSHTARARGVSVSLNASGDVAVAWSGARVPGEEVRARVAFARRNGPWRVATVGRRLAQTGFRLPPSVFAADTGAMTATWVCGAYLCSRDLPASAAVWGSLFRSRFAVPASPQVGFRSDGATIATWAGPDSNARFAVRPAGRTWPAARGFDVDALSAGHAIGPSGDMLLLSSRPSGQLIGRDATGGRVGRAIGVLTAQDAQAPVSGVANAAGDVIAFASRFYGNTGHELTSAIRWASGDRAAPAGLRASRSGRVTFRLRPGAGPFELRVARPGATRPRLIHLGVGGPGINTVELPLRRGDVVTLETGHRTAGRVRARVP